MTTTSSATSGTISSLGVGSGLDANSIVSKLVSLERQPITQLQTDADKIQSKISAFGQVQSAVSTMRDAAKKLANPDIWASMTATSSDTSTVNFTTSSGAAAGNYAVSVSSLASSQSVVTKTALASSSATLGSGTVTIDIGKWNSTTSAFDTTSTASVNVLATDSLEKIRDKINDAGAGVTASIVKDASGARLVMTSTKTGEASGFRVTTTDTGDGNDTDNAGLSALAYNPDPAVTNAGTTRTQQAKDAAASINGIEVKSATNQFSDVLTGISFTVGKVTTNGTVDTPASVVVKQDNDAISKAITDFATSYSSLVTMLRTNTKYDESTKTAGTLQGDGTAVGILNQLRATTGSTSGNSTVFNTLSSIGVEVQAGGTLTVNSTKLTNALGKLSEVKKLFANASTTSSQDGIATKLRTLGDNLLGFEGAITTRTAGLKKAVDSNQKRQDELDARATLFEKRLRAQYTSLDQTMSNLSGQSSYVTQMITKWNNS